MLNQGIGAWPGRLQRKSGSKPAVVFNGEVLTYSGLHRRALALAGALRARGAAAGDRVAFLGENHPSFLETFFAAGMLGAVFVPLNTRLAPPELAYALADSGAGILVHSAGLEPLAVAGSAQVQVRRLVVPDAGASAGAPSPAAPAGQDDAGEDYEQALASAAALDTETPVGLDDPAMILYTSGTTGRPKGAVLTHGNLTWNCFNVLVDYDLGSSDVALMISPLFHVASLDMGVLPTLLKGGTVILEPKFDAGRALELIEQHRATFISGVPTTYQMLCEHPDWAKRDIGSLQKLTCGGSAVPLRVIEAYEARGLAFSCGYGMTETAPGATAVPSDRSREKAGSAGLPHFFTGVRVAAATGEPAGVGEVGEVQIAGPNVIREYWQRPDATEAAFAEGGWFRSGDLGYLDDDGFLFVVDRLKDMIISGGENIYPAEVEQAILALEQVASAAVIGVPDEKWGEVPHAVVVLREGAELDGEAIRAHLAGRLARYKIPRTFEFVTELPRTASGKIRKTDLRRRHAG